jgi:hypothetical protein
MTVPTKCATRAEEDEMNRFLTIPLAGLVALAVAGPVAAGSSVSNTSGSVTMAQGYWESFDEASGTYSSGGIAVSQEQGSSLAWASYNQSSEQMLQCTGAGTPDDPDDDTFGVSATYIWGDGEATLTIGKSYSSATSSATVTLTRESFNECTGDYSNEELGDQSVGLELTASSSTIKESGRGSFHLPGQLNEHSKYQATYRLAGGTLSGIDGEHSAEGQIGKVSWSDHSNG